LYFYANLRIYENYAQKTSEEKHKWIKPNLNKEINIVPFKIQSVKKDNDSCFTNRYTGDLKNFDPFSSRLHTFMY